MTWHSIRFAFLAAFFLVIRAVTVGADPGKSLVSTLVGDWILLWAGFIFTAMTAPKCSGTVRTARERVSPSSDSGKDSE